MCLVIIKYKNSSWTKKTVPYKYVFDFKEWIFLLNTFTFHKMEYISWKYICLLEIWISWFKKELVPFRKLLVPFRTTKDCLSCRSLLLVWQICSLNWDLDMDSFVGTLYISFDGPVPKYLLVMQGAWVWIQGVIFNTFSWWHPWEPRFKSGFHNSFWDYLVPDRISWMTLELYKWNLGTSFG